MWLASRTIAVAALVALQFATCSARAQVPAATEQDQVADYLERMNLQGLLLEHLSSSMRAADAEARVKIAERLARHYAGLLAEAPDEARRTELVGKAEGLLKLVPQARAYELRVGLLKARYTAAEEQAERVRLRYAGAEVRAEAMKNLADIRVQLVALAGELTKKEETLSRALDGGPADADRYERDLNDTRRWRSTAQYFGGWAGVYHALLDGSPAIAVEAEREFRPILAAGDAPTPAKLDKSLLKYEHIARASIGLAVCRSLQGQDAEAISWLDLLQQSSSTDQAVRSSLIRWRITILASAGRWADLDRDVRRARSGQDEPPAVKLPSNAVAPAADRSTLDPISARLLAVLAIESKAAPTQPITKALARLAVGDLIARKQLASVLDLARKYGADSLTDGDGSGGFIARYVRGMQSYETAVAATKAAGLSLEDPVTPPALVNQFNDAAAQLTQAVSETDAPSFKTEQGTATAISARALFMAGKLREAAERFSLSFERSRDAGDAQGAQENLYLAIVTLEKALKRDPGKVDTLAIDERIDQLSTLFIKTYPSSERAVTLTLRSIARTDRTDEEAVRVLQSVNKDSAAYEAARRQLARLLYRQYRNSPPADRPFASARYIKVADEVMAIDRKSALEAKGEAVPPAVERTLATGRQMLDAVLSVTPPDAAKAEQVMGIIKQVLLTTSVPSVQWIDELDFRSVQILLARGQLDKADALADTLRARLDAAKPGTESLASARRFHAAARRVLLQHADNALRAATSDPIKAAAATRVLAHGLPITDEILPTPESLKDASSAAVCSRVAEAGAVLWRTQKDSAARDASLRLDRALLAARGPSVESLARVAELSEPAGDQAGAMDAWRTLASITSEDTPQWHQAKCEFFRLLAMTDTKGASAAVGQYLILYPTGPEPWQSKARELAGRLGVSAPAPSSQDGSQSGGGPGGGPR